MIDFETIPEKTGVYIFKDCNDKIIYVGKANSLRQRVKQYFIGNQDLRPQVEFIKKETVSVDFRLAGSEHEALILEYNLISSLKPKYNVKLKDSSKYPYIMLSNEEFPFLSYVYAIDRESSFFGPFTSGLYVKTLVEKLNKIYHLRVCKKKLPKRVCIEYQMANCFGVCEIQEERASYKMKIQKIKKILNGGTKNILQELEKDMASSAENEDFERAALIRDTLSFIKKEMRRGTKTGLKDKNEDIFAMAREKNSGAFSILRLRNGTVHEIITKRFSANSHIEDASVMKEILAEYYLTNTDFDFNKLAVKDGNVDEIKKSISQLKEKDVKTISKDSYEEKLFETAFENAANALYYSINKKFTSKSVIQLKNDLLLEKIPEYIIGLDISHVSGDWTSGAVVAFKDGKPLKSSYRYYNLENIGNNDYLALSTILKRYLEKHPADMILIDGGLGQLSSCMKVIKETGKTPYVFALAKRFDTLYDSNGKEIMLNGRTAGGNLIRSVRDESHRFANKLRKIKMEKIKKNGRKNKNSP